MGEEVAGRAVGGKGLPVRSQAGPVRVHEVVKSGEVRLAVGEETDKFWKLQKAVVASRSCRCNDLLCQRIVLSFTTLWQPCRSVGTQEAEIVEESPPEEMIEGWNKARQGSIYCGRLRKCFQGNIETQQEKERGKVSERKRALTFSLFLTFSSLSLRRW